MHLYSSFSKKSSRHPDANKRSRDDVAPSVELTWRSKQKTNRGRWRRCATKKRMSTQTSYWRCTAASWWLSRGCELRRRCIYTGVSNGVECDLMRTACTRKGELAPRLFFFFSVQWCRCCGWCVKTRVKHSCDYSMRGFKGTMLYYIFIEINDLNFITMVECATERYTSMILYKNQAVIHEICPRYIKR